MLNLIIEEVVSPSGFIVSLQVPTDGLILKGWYNTITVAIYGVLTIVKQEHHQSPPPPPPPQPRAKPQSKLNLKRMEKFIIFTIAELSK